MAPRLMTCEFVLLNSTEKEDGVPLPLEIVPATTCVPAAASPSDVAVPVVFRLMVPSVDAEFMVLRLPPFVASSLTVMAPPLLVSVILFGVPLPDEPALIPPLIKLVPPPVLLPTVKFKLPEL